MRWCHQNHSLTTMEVFEDITAEIYPIYQKQLMLQNALDFGDLIYLTVKLLSENKRF